MRRRWHGSGRRPTPARPCDTPCRTAHRTDSRAIPSLWHATPPGASEPSVEVVGSSPISRLSAPSYVGLELRPLPSAGITRLRRYYGPVRHPRRPGLSLAGFRLAVTHRHRLGLPVLCWVSCAGMPSPLPRWDHWADVASRELPPRDPVTAAFPVMSAGRLPHHCFRGLLSVHSRYGLPARRVA